MEKKRESYIPERSCKRLRVGETPRRIGINICQFPPEILHFIFGYLSCKDISRLRSVNTVFKKVASCYLNETYCTLKRVVHRKLEKLVSSAAQERRGLSVLDDELEVVDALCWKHMESSRKCFFPGEILDAIWKILRLCKNLQVADGKVESAVGTLWRLNEKFARYFLQRSDILLSGRIVLDVVDISTCCSHIESAKVLEPGEVTVYFILNNFYFQWGFHPAHEKAISGTREAKLLLRHLSEFIFHRNRQCYKGKKHETTYTVVYIGNKYFSFTNQCGICSRCHQTEIGVRIRYPCDSVNVVATKEENESERDYMHRLYRALPQKRSAVFYMKNIDCCDDGHTCPSSEDCWRLEVRYCKYSALVENNWCGNMHLSQYSRNYR